MAIIHLKNTPSDGAYVMFEGREMSKPVDGLESVVRPLTIARDHEYVFNDVSEI